MKLKASSTIEAVMTMILSGIVLCAVSAGFLFVMKSFKAYTGVNDSVNEQVLFSASMNHDFVNCEYINKSENSLSFYFTNNNFHSYEFTSSAIVKHTASKTDTFHVQYENFSCYLDGTEIFSSGLTDALKLNTGENKTLYFSKVYAMDRLLQDEMNELTTGSNGI